MILSLENVRLALGTFELSIDLVVEGRVAGIFGPSGAGKTSLLELVAGIRRPRAGRIVLDGRVLCDDRVCVAPRHRRVGYVPQDLALFPHRNVRGNLVYGMPSPHPAARLSTVCEMLEITPLLDRMPGQLSGGEKQRVAFARAILAEPALLLLDEPLSSLDHPLKERILPHLLRIRDEIGLPMLYVTHSADEIVRLCDQMAVLEAGRIVARGAPLDLLEDSGEIRHRLRARQ